MKKLIANSLALGALLAAIPSLAWGPSLPRPNIPRPNIPRPNIPTPNIPRPNIPRPNIPRPTLPNPQSWTETSNNIEQKRQDLRRESRAVILGKHIDHAEYIRFGSAIAAAVATENPAPVQLYLQNLLVETKRELTRNGSAEAQRVARALTMEVFMNLMNAAYRGQGPQIYQFRGVKVKAGFVTYAHYKRIITKYPYLSAGQVKWRTDENRIGLPNTHQIYIGVDF